MAVASGIFARHKARQRGKGKRGAWTCYGYAWVTLGFFLISIMGHWLFAWYAYLDEQQAHGLPVEISGYLVETARDTLENWQSEFLQLLWQVGGLSILLFAGSPQSKEGSERIEEKIDALLQHLSKDEGKRLITEIDKKYPGRH